MACDKRIIEALEQLLDCARDGDLIALAVVTVLRYGDVVTALQVPEGRLIEPLVLGTHLLSEKLASGLPLARIN